MIGDLIKDKEGLASINRIRRVLAPKDYNGLLYPYLCEKGVKTIGWGHTMSFIKNPSIFDQGITIAKCQELFDNDYQIALQCLKQRVKINMSDNQQEALICLIYNIGIGHFAKSSLLKHLNNNDDIARIKESWLAWNKIRDKHGNLQFSAGLARRREDEFNFFCQS